MKVGNKAGLATKPSKRRVRDYFWPIILILLIAIQVEPVAGTSRAEASTPGGDTFDIYCMFPQQTLAPAVGSNFTFVVLETRNIVGVAEEAVLGESESRYFEASMKPDRVIPRGKWFGNSRVEVKCAKDTPEGTVGWIKVIGSRGERENRIWIKVTALTSEPRLEFSRGTLLTGEGYMDPGLQPFTGKPLTWKLAATNRGGSEDTIQLVYRADFACEVKFRDNRGKIIDRVKVAGLIRNLPFARAREITVEVVPLEELPKNQPREIALTSGRGRYTGSVAEAVVKVVNPGLLFCMNELQGLRPHPHQVMPGEKDSFIFHLSNIDGKGCAVRVCAPGQNGSWRASLDENLVEALKPADTVQVTMTVEAPRDARVGDRLELVVAAESSLGRREEAKVAVGVTRVPNIYYWSVDSMDPEYLDLNWRGDGPGSEGDWSMPNLRAFLGEGVHYGDARVYLPSATDMNHTNALAGSYTGTQGIYMVGGTYLEFTEHDEAVAAPNSMRFMYHGKEGMPLERVFEVAKRETEGKSSCGFWSNKNWLADLEGERAVDVVGHCERWPLFFLPPWKYRAAGDSRSDDDPKDRPSASFGKSCFHSNDLYETVIPSIHGQFDAIPGTQLLNVPIGIIFGKIPGMHCEDRYLVESFFHSIGKEDPDVCPIDVADLDNTGRFTGSSWNLEEWGDGKPSSLSDDESKYSPWVRREDCLDILGMPGVHGGLQTTHIPLVFKAPVWFEGYTPGGSYASEVEVGDIAPNIYLIMGWTPPGCVDGKPLPEP
jgi:hypothetical protein